MFLNYFISGVLVTILMLIMWSMLNVGFTFKFNLVLGLFSISILSVLWFNFFHTPVSLILVGFILCGGCIIVAVMVKSAAVSPSIIKAGDQINLNTNLF